MGYKVDYGAWWTYVFARLGGLELAEGMHLRDMRPRRSQPGKVVLTSMADRRDWQLFAEAYGDPESGISVGRSPVQFPVVRHPLTYTGQEAV
jgi:5-methyltetrahydropteroyltriglutamate--homocysteine methyltransferase